MARFTSLFLLVLFPFFVNGQNVVSTKKFEYKKPVPPYFGKYVIPLEELNTVILIPHKKRDQYLLARYDQYFFDQWKQFIDLKSEGEVPQLLRMGEKAILFNHYYVKKEKFLKISIKHFDLQTGTLEFDTTLVAASFVSKNDNPRLALSPDNSKLLIFDTYSADRTSNLFTVFDLENGKKILSQSLLPTEWNKNGNAALVTNEGQVYLTIADALAFKLFAKKLTEDPARNQQMESTFFFERPLDDMKFITLSVDQNNNLNAIAPSYIENELIGINKTKFNFTSNEVECNSNVNFTDDSLKRWYKKAHLNYQKLNKKSLKATTVLEDFYLIGTFQKEDGDILCFIEEGELPNTYNKPIQGGRRPSNWKEIDDSKYTSGDLMVLCFSSVGKLKWQKIFQKDQQSYINPQALSFGSRFTNNQLIVVSGEASKDASFYKTIIDTNTGNVLDVEKMFKKKYLEQDVNYFCWLEQKVLLMCTYPMENAVKREFKMIEWEE